jgi:MOSC domain-containing protein
VSGEELDSPRSGMFVKEIWRYPVKSMGGEQLRRVEVGVDGVPGDRLVHVRGARGLLTGRTRHGLLTMSGSTGADGLPRVDGHRFDEPAAAARVVEAAGPDARLVAADVPERFDVLPLLVATEAEMDRLGVDRRRLRPNIVIGGAQGAAERGWPGHALRIADLLIGVYSLRARCIVTTIDPDTGAQDLDVLRRIRRDFGGTTALDCWVATPGTISVGDPVQLVRLPADAPRPNPGGWVVGVPYPLVPVT